MAIWAVDSENAVTRCNVYLPRTIQMLMPPLPSKTFSVLIHKLYVFSVSRNHRLATDFMLSSCTSTHRLEQRPAVSKMIQILIRNIIQSRKAKDTYHQHINKGAPGKDTASIRYLQSRIKQPSRDSVEKPILTNMLLTIPAAVRELM